MKEYIQLTFSALLPEQADILIARLSEADYEGFEETENTLKAYISAEKFDEKILSDITYKYQIKYTRENIPPANWNQLWESGFQPVTIEDFCTIRAAFHPPQKKTQYEIVITPKQSFGTGHHSTTYLMIQQMQKVNFVDKTVLDFGTGTGILAILAEKLGAKKIIAADNDEWSIENSAENIEVNYCSHIRVLKSDIIPDNFLFDIILSNINKNEIISQMPAMIRQLSPGGIIIISGLIEEDETDFLETVKKHPLKVETKSVRNNWISFTLRHQISSNQRV